MTRTGEEYTGIVATNPKITKIIKRKNILMLTVRLGEIPARSRASPVSYHGLPSP